MIGVHMWFQAFSVPLEKKFSQLQSVAPGDCAAFIDVIF